jgi:hypothetical protein
MRAKSPPQGGESNAGKLKTMQSPLKFASFCTPYPAYETLAPDRAERPGPGQDCRLEIAYP